MKKGFTLAEVLVTLGVIGIVAALAMPALNNSFQKSKVGPSLRKFISTMEVAHEHILGENDATKLSSIFLGENKQEAYFEELTKFVKGSIERTGSGDIKKMSDYKLKTYEKEDFNGPFTADNYNTYSFANNDSVAVTIFGPGNKEFARGSYKGEFAEFIYDINGFNTDPNILGKDLFVFRVDDNGSVIPYGGKTMANAYVSILGTDPEWEKTNSCTENKVVLGRTCAGSVADNGWKVIYKY